jgi:uncharacterized protein
LAESNLGDMYLEGEGVLRDRTEAFRWFGKAAEQGHTGAQIELAYMYAAGAGVDKNLESAYMWAESASLAGDDRGKTLLQSPETQLTAEQLAVALEQARVRHPDANSGAALSAKDLAQ